jgi:hypothetical protein
MPTKFDDKARAGFVCLSGILLAEMMLKLRPGTAVRCPEVERETLGSHLIIVE